MDDFIKTVEVPSNDLAMSYENPYLMRIKRSATSKKTKKSSGSSGSTALTASQKNSKRIQSIIMRRRVANNLAARNKLHADLHAKRNRNSSG